jgi:magnesium chelatase family protein
MQIVGFARFGYAGEIVKIEADLRRGIPAVDIVGLPDGAVREARERMRAAIRNSGLEYPRERILLNLSPADLKKEGSSFDLPIALAVLGASKGTEQKADQGFNTARTQNDRTSFGATQFGRTSFGADTVMALGELELSGAVRPVRGVLAAVSRGLAEGIVRFIVPADNQIEARSCPGAEVAGVRTLTEALHAYRNPSCAAFATGASSLPDGAEAYRSEGGTYEAVWSPDVRVAGDYADVRGQSALVRALQIAAAGGHNLIAYGPPGCGKTLALSRFPALLPDLDPDTAVTVTRIHSLAGLSQAECCTSRIHRPPFREPHQNASLEGIIGGGTHGSPGEISLAHGGALFLDEAAQFRSSVLQALRTPLETGAVSVSRAGRTSTFPARFQLLLAVNPCPCGHYGSPGRICTCTAESISAYWKRLAAPLLDRIELRVRVLPGSGDELMRTPGFSTAGLRADIGKARRMQWTRNRKAAGPAGWLNSHLNGSRLQEVCAMEGSAARTFALAADKTDVSSRGAHALLRVARTIADLAGEARVGEDHILEACSLRKWSDTVPDFLGA